VLPIVTAVAYALNDSAFVAFRPAGAIVYCWRRLWPEAVLVAAISLAGRRSIALSGLRLTPMRRPGSAR
jgi:hypothetical protein